MPIDGVMDSGLRLAANEEFDRILEEFGKIIVKTHDDTEENGVQNGRKKLRIDLNPGSYIERW